ncbi:MAG: response regulator transcription factor [Candidatus Heimdallarchaeota archaeon]|nr:response regulator transcription factor [Candidatus Heimdallarchaeota archaeon]
MKVLIADDSLIMRDRLSTLLSENENGIEITYAGNPSDTVRLIKKNKPDVIVLEIRMRGGFGIDVLQKIKKKNAAPVVIIFTSCSYPQYRKKCTETGADFFFAKSTDFDKIPEVLKKIKDGAIREINDHDKHYAHIHNIQKNNCVWNLQRRVGDMSMSTNV